jgi:hypothetical protein
MVSGSRDSYWALTLVLLQHMVPQLMQKYLFQHKSLESIGWPIHRGCVRLPHESDPSSGSFESLSVFLQELSMQMPRRQNLFEEKYSAGNLVSTKY